MNIKPIPEHVVKNIHDKNSFFEFLRSELNWNIPAEIYFEDATYEWFQKDLGISESDLRATKLFQLRPMSSEQPWGIFFLEFATPKLHVTELRKILRGLSPNKRHRGNFPAWNPQHLLFLCTHDWKNYTIAHFDSDTPQKAKLSSFGWEYQSSYIRTVCEFNLSALRLPESDMFNTVPPSDWLKQWTKAFDVKSVTDNFYVELKKVFNEIQEYIHGIAGERKRSFAQLMINRLLFLKFLERKSWLFVNENDTAEERHAFLKRQRERFGEQNQWDQFFSRLFYRGLNRFSIPGTAEQTNALHTIIGYVPFLNGGLFEQSPEEKEKHVKIDNELFDIIFSRLLDRYNFTIYENSPLDVEVALNPDLLGYAYEELIAERHGQGAFYTHPTEVGLMCREVLKTYLEEHTSVSYKIISQLIDERTTQFLSDDEAFSVYRLLLKIKILDPAIGSGAYPVRMMQELVLIQKALAEKLQQGTFRNVFENKLEHPHCEFDLKLSIIQNNLYGVDIDTFAVEIAKLRFWLSLVVDYDIEVKNPDDLRSIPALPNLDFKLRVGESLISTPGKVKKKKGETEAIANLDIIVGQVSNLSNKTQDIFFLSQIEELRKLKETFFQFEELRKQNPKLYSTSKDELKKQIAKKENEVAAELGFPLLEKDIDALPHILWQIHFAEVFVPVGQVSNLSQSEEQLGKLSYKVSNLSQTEGQLGKLSYGFDICIANPPYVRQEKINELFELFNIGIRKDDLAREYEKLFEHLKLSINKQSDVYVYFFMRGVHLLKEHGVLCFICSNSWLDVGYGAGLQEFLLRTTRIKTIYDNSAKRSFEKADVNTTINVFVKDSSVNGIQLQTSTKQESADVLTENVTRFVTFRKPFEEAAATEELQTIAETTTITSNEMFRVYPIPQKELWKQGLETQEVEYKKSGMKGEREWYAGDKWGGKYLRAPDIFFTILEKGKDKLVRLGDIADVRRGFTTGANEFFYLDEEKIAEWNIEKEFLKPILKTAKGSSTFIIDKSKLTTFLFLCDRDKKEIKGTNALKYILWGESKGFHYIQSVRSRKNWYDVGHKESSDAIMLRRIGERLPFFESNGVLEDCVLFGITLKEKIQNELFFSTLNCMWTRLYIELTTRPLTGAQAVADTNVYIIKDAKIFDPRTLINEEKNILVKVYRSFRTKESLSIFEELGFNKTKPIRSQTPQPLPDRKALDDIIFDALDLTQAERTEIYYAVCELVQNRLQKAKRV